MGRGGGDCVQMPQFKLEGLWLAGLVGSFAFIAREPA